MKKTLSLLLALTLCLTLFAGCGTNNTPATTAPTTQTTAPEAKALVNLAVLKGPTGMGAAKLMAMDEAGETANDYTFTVASAPDQITAKLVSGQLDIASIPTNAVSALYNKTGGKVTLLAINTLGVLYILSKDASVKTLADLKGKTVLASGKGSTAEVVLNYLLEKAGVKEEVTVEYAAEHAEAAAKAASGDYDIVMLPEPFVTSLTLQNKDFTVALNLTEEWEKASGSALTMGAVAVRTEFLQQNPTAIANFLTEYKASVDYTNADVAGAAALIEKYDIAKAAVAKNAIPRCSITMLTGADMKSAAESFLTVIADFDAPSIGGKLPGKDFYYIAS